MEGSAALLAADRGLREIMMFTTFARDQACRARERLEPTLRDLAERAQAAGVVRRSPAHRPPPFLLMLATAADYTAPVRPGVWRQYLRFLLNSLRPACAAAGALPEPALSPEEVVQAMRAGPAHGRRPARPRPSARCD